MSTGPFSNSISGGLFGTPAANTVKSTQVIVVYTPTPSNCLIHVRMI
jgi:hypothetical protein